MRRPPNKTNHKFLLVSLISPFFSANICFLNQLSTNHKKLLLKQSYMFLTWVYYLSFLADRRKKKNKLSFFVLPVRRRVFTLTKAPMAHKNFSKEQYQTKFYKIKISFFGVFLDENVIDSVDAALLFVMLTKATFPVFETNLLFLKYYNFFFLFKDNNYFNFNSFLK